MKTKHNFAAGMLVLGLMASVAPAMAGQKLPPVTTENGVSTQSATAADAFPGLKGFLNLSAADRSQINVYYTARIKNADPSKVRITLTDGGRSQDLSVARDGRITPLPTRDQLNNGARVTISGPATGTYAMRIHVYSTQSAGRTYDAAGLATGVRQGNAAMGKIAGALSLLLKKLDRVYFVGGGSGTVLVDGQERPLPRTDATGEYPAGTPYFQPSAFPGATKITLSTAPSIALFDNPPK
ncbi:hypothetical protein [Asticcacaulis solisilvae]|uniref:hypothetical protein n=1 Tax=Asticcacaulis solisilvae TaxID=1217274 RepID=UPI003FD72B6B